MQRFNFNLSVVAMVVGITLVGGSVFAKGGGGHSGSGHSGSSHGKAGHKSGSHASHDHAAHHHVTNNVKLKNGNKNSKVVHNGLGRFPGHIPGRARWHYHMHYPVGFWFGGGIELGGDVAVAGGIDVEYTRIQRLDAGDPAKNLAPAYRVWFHNNSDVDIVQPFDVAILASTDEALSQGLPYASVRVDGMAADETMSVDIRLPIEAMKMAGDDGAVAPFAYVHTIIDSQRELVETDKANNLSVDSREDIPDVAE
jgi:hypothetical protein